MANRTLSTRKAWQLIFLSVILINGTALLGLSYYSYLQVQQRTDPVYNVVALVQTTSQRDLLKAGQLAELLQLSVDEPTNLFSCNCREAEEKLKATIAIKEATVKKIRPGTLHVDLEMRQPVALLGNFANTAFDNEGVLFPLKPYFTPKKIPVVYFDPSLLSFSNQRIWGNRLTDNALVHTLLTTVSKILGDATQLVSIDLSRFTAPFLGQRQIVLVIEECEEKMVEQSPEFWKSKRILRLSPDNWERQLHHYVHLRQHQQKALFQDPHVIDLRLTNRAYI